MWLPWRRKTGLAKAAVILTTILSIATVSCGLNFALALNANSAFSALIVTGWVELGIMAASAAGLLVVLVIWLAAKGRAAMRKESDD
jgi:hypothetical protein